VATCSPHNFSLAKSLGAVAVFDYHSATCGDEIRELTKNTLCYALDCISDTRSMKICYAAISSRGGKYLSLDPFPIRGHTRRSIKPNWIICLTMFNTPINWKRPFNRDAKPKDREFAEGWFKIAQKLLDDEKIQPFPHQLKSGGLEGVIKGMESVRKGEVSGIKLVYQVRE
jgi:aspyridone synthetase trans-acting enoyl reductase